VIFLSSSAWCFVLGIAVDRWSMMEDAILAQCRVTRSRSSPWSSFLSKASAFQAFALPLCVPALSELCVSVSFVLSRVWICTLFLRLCISEIEKLRVFFGLDFASFFNIGGFCPAWWLMRDVTLFGFTLKRNYWLIVICRGSLMVRIWSFLGFIW